MTLYTSNKHESHQIVAGVVQPILNLNFPWIFVQFVQILCDIYVGWNLN